MAVAVCADEHDVATCVDWARRYHVRPVARGGGHSYAGFSTTRGLLIDMSLLNRVRVNQARGTMTLGGGTLNGHLFKALKGGHLFLPVGTCLGVGAGGLTLGGGMGYNTRWAGLTCDHLQSSRIVTADGDLRDIDARQHGDLYWACRGGAGGSFGINTSFTFDLLEVPRKTVSYYLAWWRGSRRRGERVRGVRQDPQEGTLGVQRCPAGPGRAGREGRPAGGDVGLDPRSVRRPARRAA